MDDELEDKVLYQTYMKLLSKFAVGVPPLSPSITYLWKLIRLYVLKPEIIICGVVVFIFLCYLQAVELWSHNILRRLQSTFGAKRSMKVHMVPTTSPAEKHSWDVRKEVSAVYAVRGRRPRMEDRYIIDENINDNTGVSFFAIFDGHGGEFAADYAKDVLVQNLYNKIIESANLAKGGKPVDSKIPKDDDNASDKENDGNRLNEATASRKSSFRKSASTAEDCKPSTQRPDVFMNKLNSLVRPLGRDSFLTDSKTVEDPKPQVYDAKTYVNGTSINFGKMVSDEVISADYKLVEAAKKTSNVAGTTLLIAIIEKSKLIVANVGDSRGVMCDFKGNAIPLSFDHKPQQVRERKRIQEAGGFIEFRGVWRVAGILATSRALGDYPLKVKKFVIPDPDILTFDLADHKPQFLILASDGLWDTFSNEDAVAFIKERLDEPHYGAKSITLESYYRGSVDNITVLVIVFKDGKYHIGSSA